MLRWPQLIRTRPLLLARRPPRPAPPRAPAPSSLQDWRPYLRDMQKQVETYMKTCGYLAKGGWGGVGWVGGRAAGRRRGRGGGAACAAGRLPVGEGPRRCRGLGRAH